MGVHERSVGGRWWRLGAVVIRRCVTLLMVVLTVVTLVTGAAAQAATGVHVVPFETRAADGTALRGDVYLPGTGGPLATVLELSPYWNTAKGPGRLQAGKDAVRPFLAAGFAVALVNLRGTGKSGGCFQWGSRLDWSDASTIVEALAAQPWSNGNVGMYGTSYEGWAQYMAMAHPPPSLKGRRADQRRDRPLEPGDTSRGADLGRTRGLDSIRRRHQLPGPRAGGARPCRLP